MAVLEGLNVSRFMIPAAIIPAQGERDNISPARCSRSVPRRVACPRPTIGSLARPIPTQGAICDRRQGREAEVLDWGGSGRPGQSYRAFRGALIIFSPTLCCQDLNKEPHNKASGTAAYGGRLWRARSGLTTEMFDRDRQALCHDENSCLMVG